MRRDRWARAWCTTLSGRRSSGGAFDDYATGQYTKEQLLNRTRTWGLTNRRGKPFTSQAIGMLLRNQLYAGIVDVPEYGVRATVARAPGFPTSRLRALRVLWSASPAVGRGPGQLSTEVALRESAARARLEVALESDSSVHVRKFDGDVKLPAAVARDVGAAAGVVVGEAGAHVV